MNKFFIFVFFFFCIVEILCFVLFFIYKLLVIFVEIRNRKFLNTIFSERKLNNWFTDDGKYLSMHNRIKLQKERAKVVSEIVNNENSQIKNLSLFKFLVKIQKIEKILAIIYLPVFIVLFFLHLGLCFFYK